GVPLSGGCGLLGAGRRGDGPGAEHRIAAGPPLQLRLRRRIAAGPGMAGSGERLRRWPLHLPAHERAGGGSHRHLPRRVRPPDARWRRVRRQHHGRWRSAGGARHLPVPGRAPRPGRGRTEEEQAMTGTGPGQENEGVHGHYAGRQAVHDLDAAAPALRAEDVQRLNRKALVFLAGIVLLLVLAIIGMLRAVGGDDGPTAVPREQAVVIPELPRVSATPAVPVPVPPPAAVEPVPVVPMPRPPQLPPTGLAVPLPGMQGPSLRDRRSSSSEAQAAQDPYMQAMLAGLQGPEASPPPVVDPATSARPILRADTLLVRGTYIRCVLETRIVTDVPGFTSCIVTEPVYSINGRRLLL